MTWLIALIGSNAGLWISGLAALVTGGLITTKALKASGAAGQRSIDTQKGMDDATAASKARSTVDGLGNAAVDEQLRQFQRK